MLNSLNGGTYWRFFATFVLENEEEANMNKSGFRRVAVLVGGSLLLLAAVQVAWFVRTYAVLTEEFSRKVTSALEKAAYEELISRTGRLRTSGTIARFSSSGENDSLRMLSLPDPLWDMDSARTMHYDSLHKIALSDIQSLRLSRFSTDSTRVMISVNGAANDKRYLTILNMQMRSGFPGRISVEHCDSLLKHHLMQADIGQRYRFSLIDKANGEEVYGFGSPSVAKALSFELPTDTEGKSAYRLQIENPNRQFFRSMGGLIFSSLAIIGLLLFSFVYLLRTLFRQKSLERMRLDFTHNITHELKTPISVASAANEALLSFGAYEDPERRNAYLGVVEAQLGSLSGMVESILSLSLYDEGSFELSLEEVALKPFLKEVLEVFALKAPRSEERRVGKECRSRWSPYH